MSLLTKEWKPTRDPSLANLIDRAEQEWGDPDQQRKSLIPYGINVLDNVTYGIDFHNGGLLVFQGEEKQRKTTVVANIVKNILTCGRWPQGWRISVDLAESGLPPSKYRDMLISMVATDLIVRWHWLGKSYSADWLLRQPLPEDRRQVELLDIPNLGIDFKFLRYQRRTETQQAAIQAAMELMRSWPLDIFGPSKQDGDTRSVSVAPERWRYCIQERSAHLIVYDHCQQMDSGNGTTGDYHKLEAITPVIAGVVVEFTGLVFIAISQVSMGSVRDARSGNGLVSSRGGKKLMEEANNVFVCEYEGGSECVVDLQESRDAPPVKVIQPLDPTSGCFIGKAWSYVKRN